MGSVAAHRSAPAAAGAVIRSSAPVVVRDAPAVVRTQSLAGVKVERIRALTNIMCATLAGLCGYLLAAFSGGAALNMGAEYLLSSIAVVVIGGTSGAGGFANVPGLWAAALFLFLLATMQNTFGAGAGVRLVPTGLIIVGVIVAASGGRWRG